jgi:hypothetical protein
MIKKVTTETGSVYIIDLVNKTWKRMEMGADSNPLRTSGGAILNDQPLEIEVGKVMNIFTEKITEKTRVIVTSLVVSIEDYNEKSN